MGVACECGLVGPSGSMNSPFHREKGCHITRISWCHVGKVKEYGDRVGGGVTPAVLPHHRTYGSVYGGSCLLTNSVSELGSVDVSPVVTKRPDRPSEFPTPTS